MFSSKVYIYTNKHSKVLFALTKLLMTDEVTRIDGTVQLLTTLFCGETIPLKVDNIMEHLIELF
jgi:hypothetical protein